MTKATVSKIYALSGLKGMSYDDMTGVIRQVLDKPDIGQKVAILDIAEIYGVADLRDRHALTLLYQRINATRR